jgi:hypothetical protein
MKQKIKQIWAKRPRVRRKDSTDPLLEQAIHNIPRITNETVAEHREKVLSGARKFIYPLQHSVHRVVLISVSILVVLVVAFTVYSLLALYRFNTTSTFMYRLTQVIPFPVARAGSDFVSYEDYLFELRHYMHYYQTQQQIDFDSEAGQEQLRNFRETALQLVIDDAYVKQLARQHGVTVSNQEVQHQVDLLRDQNRLGGSNAVFEDVLKEFWGWSIDDFERKLRQQILAQKVVSTLDVQAHERAQEVFNRLESGEDFAELARRYSDDDATKQDGGNYGFAIERTSRDLPPQVIDALFDLKAGETSGIVETPLGLEILKVNEVDGSRVRASHIFFAFKDINTYIEPLKEENRQRVFISN